MKRKNCGGELPKKRAALEGAAEKNQNPDHNELPLANQRPKRINLTGQNAVVLSELRQGCRTTFDLRSIGVMSPASRVQDLEERGVEIHASEVDIEVDGRLHKRVARYCLVSESKD